MARDFWGIPEASRNVFLSDDLPLQIKGISRDRSDFRAQNRQLARQRSGALAWRSACSAALRRSPDEPAPVTELSPPYLRQQADRFQRFPRSCMDLTTARDLRLMADEYFAEAAAIEAN